MGVRLFSPRASEAGGEPASSRIPFGREAAALLLLAAATYLALAVVSLPTLVAEAAGEQGNWVGPVGAWLAELLVAGNFSPDDRVLELYCGAGNFTLPIAKRVESVTAIEGHRQALAGGKLNAQKNAIAVPNSVALSRL